MDAFFASVEQRDYPEYRGKPLVVGGQPDSRGVVAAASYEARRFGIHSAMSSAQAYRLCPQTLFIKPRIDSYRVVSDEIREIFQGFTDIIEPLSLDEAYLDVSDTDYYQGSATRIAQAIREKIKKVTHLTASAGVSYNKFLAKIASDLDKPDGLSIITPEQGETFVAELPIERFYGVGQATTSKMHRLGIRSGADLKQLTIEELLHHFGKSAHYYYQIARGQDSREVRCHRIRKSIGCETTFQTDLLDLTTINQNLGTLSQKLSGLLSKREVMTRTLTLKIKYADFEQITRSQTLEQPVQIVEDISPLILELVTRSEAGIRPVRLLGLSASNLCSHDGQTHKNQLQLFSAI